MKKTSHHAKREFRSAKDKRSHQRYIAISPVGLKIFQNSKREIPIVKILDISQGGLSIITVEPLDMAKVWLRFEPLSLSAPQIECTADVVRIQEWVSDVDNITRYECALALNLTSKEKQHWSEFIKEILHLGSAFPDRRSEKRVQNGLVFLNPGKHRTYVASQDHPLFEIQQLTLKDLDELEKVEIAAWGKDMCATRAMLQTRFETFPEGMIGARLKGKLIGYVGLMLTNRDELQDNFTWESISDGGFIRKTHKPNGDCLYGVSLSVIPSVYKNVAVLLLKAAGKLSIRKSVRGIYLGARMPGYHRFHHKYSPDQYVRATTKSGRILDPEIALYRQVNCNPIRVIPNYFEDPASHNYGVLVFWLNPFYEIQKNEYPFFFHKVTVDFT